MTLRISELRQAHKKWFARGNQAFFADLGYRILHDKQGTPYLVRHTEAFTDMFTGVRVPHWRINPIGPNLEIKNMVDRHCEP